MKKWFLILLFVPAFCFGQQKEVICTGPGEPVLTCLDADPDDVRELKESINALIDERAGLLHTQQEYNQGNANQRKRDYNDRIDELEGRAADAANDKARDFWQAKADDLKARRDYHDSEEPGSPRDIASKLGPQISALMQEINDLKQELRAIE